MVYCDQSEDGLQGENWNTQRKGCGFIYRLVRYALRSGTGTASRVAEIEVLERDKDCHVGIGNPRKYGRRTPPSLDGFFIFYSHQGKLAGVRGILSRGLPTVSPYWYIRGGPDAANNPDNAPRRGPTQKGCSPPADMENERSLIWEVNLVVEEIAPLGKWRRISDRGRHGATDPGDQ